MLPDKTTFLKKRLNNLYAEYLDKPKQYDEIQEDIINPLDEAMQLVEEAQNYGIKDATELLSEVFNLIESANTSAYFINRKIEEAIPSLVHNKL